MAKYYVQSGDTQFVVSAADAEGAALWVLNQKINECFPVDDLEDRLLDSEAIEYLICGLDGMAEVMHVSEIGWGRSEAAELQTELLFEHWCQLICAMNHLFDQMN